MDITDDFSYVAKQHNSEHSKLYSFLATNYDISSLANKIHATKKAQMNVLSLRKGSGLSI